MDGDLRREVEALRQQLYDLQRRLAGAEQPTGLPAEPFDVLRCVVGGEHVAFLLDEVREVLPRVELGLLPEAPPWVSGLLGINGRHVPVIDVEARIRRRARAPLMGDFIILSTDRGAPVGLLVQDVIGLERVDPAQVAAPAPGVPMGPYLAGVVACAPRPLLLFSLAVLVASSDVPAAAGDGPVADKAPVTA
ncbi:MAG: chemotaxis protein CheW [Deltaproteobacteria bacterium]|nr:chemotaxis protein CheW [Deltaproteobacteria bacterium]